MSLSRTLHIPAALCSHWVAALAYALAQTQATNLSETVVARKVASGTFLLKRAGEDSGAFFPATVVISPLHSLTGGCLTLNERERLFTAIKLLRFARVKKYGQTRTP